MLSVSILVMKVSTDFRTTRYWRPNTATVSACEFYELFLKTLATPSRCVGQYKVVAIKCWLSDSLRVTFSEVPWSVSAVPITIMH